MFGEPRLTGVISIKNRLIKEKLKVLVAAAAAIEAAMSCQRQQVVHVHRTLHCAYHTLFFY